MPQCGVKVESSQQKDLTMRILTQSGKQHRLHLFGLLDSFAVTGHGTKRSILALVMLSTSRTNLSMKRTHPTISLLPKPGPDARLQRIEARPDTQRTKSEHNIAGSGGRVDQGKPRSPSIVPERSQARRWLC